ncbi:SH3 domain-containing protein, partial [Nesterenkonia halotolerans]
TLAPGTTIKINGKKGSWLRFNDGSRNLWVHQNYVNKVTASAPASSTGVSKASGSYKVQRGVTLNVRSEASASSSKVKTLKSGTTIKVNGKKGSWVSFKDGSRTLWVHSGYLDKVSSSRSAGSGSGSETVPGGTESSESSASTAADGTYKVSSGVQLNARTGAGTSNSSVKMLKPGTTVKATGEKGDWVSFKDGSRTLWVHSDFLTKASSSTSSSQSRKSDSDSSSSSSKSSTSSTTAASGAFQVKSGISLNARTGASTSSSSAKVLKAGTKVSVTGKKGEWVSFKDGSRTLWLHSGYLVKASASAPSKSTSSSSSSSSDKSSSASKSSTSSTTAASGAFQVKSGISLNARTGASTSSSSAKVLKAGTKVSVTGKKGEWVSFKDGSRTLWVHSGYLVKASASAPSKSTSSSSSSKDDSSDSSSSSSSSSIKSASGTYHVRSGVYLNARSGPDISNRVVLNLNPKREIQVTGRSGDWVRFTYSGKAVWVKAEFLEKGSASDAAPESSSGSTSGPVKKANSTNSTSKVVGVAYSTNSVNVRMGPSTNNSAMFSVRTGTKVELLEKKKDGWQEVKVNGATGWMSAQLLTSKAPSSTGTSTSGSKNSGSSGSTSGSSSSSNMHAKSKNGPYSAVWDKLAQCESGQNWKIDTGNGFYGGVQFSPESWEGVGGSGFPHEASKEEQIKRAYMLWKKQGWNAWPHCTSQFGFKGDPGGYGDSYYKVHPNAKTASAVTQADSWTATYSVPLRESAATSSDKLVQVPRGVELKQLKRDGSWLKVEYTSGGETHTGWVNTSYISQA